MSSKSSKGCAPQGSAYSLWHGRRFARFDEASTFLAVERRGGSARLKRVIGRISGWKGVGLGERVHLQLAESDWQSTNWQTCALCCFGCGRSHGQIRKRSWTRVGGVCEHQR